MITGHAADAERENPYVGFRPFLTRDALYFFGRDEQTRALLQCLRRHHFVSVVGNSGSGKSSLVLAGVIPTLVAGFLVSDRDQWMIASMRPGDAPLEHLAQALIETVGADAAGASREALADDIRARGFVAVAEVLARRAARANLLLLADQFEELFAFMAAAGSEVSDAPGRPVDASLVEERIRRHADAQTFVSVLMALAATPDGHSYVITTMRTDFLGDCDRFPGLPELINSAGYLVPRLARAGLRDAIEGPARLKGVRVTPRLSDFVLNEVGDRPDLLPLLQHALHRTWQARASMQDQGPLDLVHLEQIGGLRSALSREADALVAGFDVGLVSAVFRRLTRVDSGRRRVRRPCHTSELLAVTRAPREQLMALLDRLSAEGTNLLYRSGGRQSDDPRFDISHESLIRQWGQLQQWIDEERALASFYAELCEKAARWRDSGELSETSMAARRALQRDVAARQLTAVWAARYANDMPATWQDVQQYLAQSRRRQRQRAMWWSLMAASVLLLVAAFVSRQREDRQWSEQQAQLAALGNLADTDPTYGTWLAAHWSRDRYTDPQAMAALDDLEQRYTAGAEFTNVFMYVPLDSGRRVAVAMDDGRVHIVSRDGVGAPAGTLGRDGRLVQGMVPLADRTMLVAMDDGEVLHWHYDGPRPHAHPVDTVRGLRYIGALGGARRALLLSADGRAAIFATGAQESLRAISRSVDLLAISPSDSGMIALYEREPGTTRGAVVQYDVDAAVPRSRWRVSASSSTALMAAYASDGASLLVASVAGAQPLEVIDRRGRLLATLPAPAYVRSVIDAGRPNSFLVTDYDGDVRLVASYAGDAEPFLTRHATAATAVRVPDHPWVLSGDDDGDVRVTWIGRGPRIATGSGLSIPLRGHGRAAGFMDLTATAHSLFTLDGSGLLRIWPVERLTTFEPAGVPSHTEAFRVMARASGAIMGLDGQASALRLGTYLLRAPGPDSTALFPLAVATDGRAAAACARRGACWLWSLEQDRPGTPRPIQLPTMHPADTALFTADGDQLLVQHGADSLFEVDVATGAVPHRYAMDGGSPWNVSRDGRVLLFRRDGALVGVWLDDADRRVQVIDASREVEWRWAPRGARLSVVAGDTLRLYTLDGDGPVAPRTLTFAATDSLFDHQIDGDGAWVAVLRGDRQVSVYRVGTGDTLVQELRLPRPRGRLSGLRFLPYGNGLLAATVDGNAELWQWRRRRVLEDSTGRPSWSASLRSWWDGLRRTPPTSLNEAYVVVRRTLAHHPSVSASYEDHSAFLAVDTAGRGVSLLVQPSWTTSRVSRWSLEGETRRTRFATRAAACLDASALASTFGAVPVDVPPGAAAGCAASRFGNATPVPIERGGGSLPPGTPAAGRMP